MENILITICARGGSIGIPEKNIKPINGKPLIYYSLNVANKFAKKYHAHIFLSTDDDKIKSVVHELNIANVNIDYVRPNILATDGAGKLDAIIDVKNFAEDFNQITYDYVLDLDVTSPLRTFEDLEQAFHIIASNREALNLFSVSPANRNPYFNMVEESGNGFYKLIKKGAFLTRQSAPKVYDLNASFYFFKKSFFDKGFKTVMTDMALIYEMPHLCFDLDHPIDFDFMTYLLEKGKLGFEL